MRERSRRASPQPDYRSLSVDAGSDLREQGKQRTRLRWLRIMREYTKSSSSRTGLGCFVEKNTT